MCIADGEGENTWREGQVTVYVYVSVSMRVYV